MAPQAEVGEGREGRKGRTWVPSNFPARGILSLQMSGVLVLAAWCFLQVESRHPEVITSSSSRGNFLDNDKWLSTVSQYDRDKYWNKFRDVSTSPFAVRSVFVWFDSSIFSVGGCWLLEDVGGREMQLGLAVAARVKDVRSGLEAGHSPGIFDYPIDQDDFGSISVLLKA